MGITLWILTQNRQQKILVLNPDLCFHSTRCLLNFEREGYRLLFFFFFSFLCLCFPWPPCQVKCFLLLSLLLWPRGNAAKEWDIHGTSTSASSVSNQPLQPGRFGEIFLFKSNLILRFIYFYFVCVSIYANQMCAWCWRSEEGVISSGTRITDGFETPSGCWEPNLGSLHELQMLLIFEPYLQLWGKSYFRERKAGRLKR